VVVSVVVVVGSCMSLSREGEPVRVENLELNVEVKVPW
jgi:hypothetical protein